MPTTELAPGPLPGTQETARPAALRGVRGFAWITVACNILVILWGTVVRATGSGNGCGDHWPLCNGTVVQHWRTAASVIEFAHRASVGVITLELIVLAVWVWKATPRRHLARISMAAACVLTFNEALLGALLVKLQLTAQNHSPERAAYLGLHQTNTFLLLAALTLAAHFLGRSSARMRGGVTLVGYGAILTAAAALLLVAISGSLAALADTLFPARTLAAAFAQDFRPGADWMLHLRWVHPAMALVGAAAVLVAVAQGLRLECTGRLPVLVAGLLGLQIVAGIADVVLLAPTWLQVVHLLVADLLWVALVVLGARMCVRPIGCTGSSCVAAESGS